MGRFPLRALYGIIVESTVELYTSERIDSKSISSASVPCACWLGIDSKSIPNRFQIDSLKTSCIVFWHIFWKEIFSLPKKIWKNNIRIMFLHVSYVPGEAFFFSGQRQTSVYCLVLRQWFLNHGSRWILKRLVEFTTWWNWTSRIHLCRSRKLEGIWYTTQSTQKSEFFFFNFLRF